MASHGRVDSKIADNITCVVDKVLTEETGHVLVFLETTVFSREAADRFALHVRSGVLPSLAYLFCQSIDESEVLIKITGYLNSNYQQYKEFVVRMIGADSVVLNQILLLDNLYNHYRDDQGNPRLHVKLEGQNSFGFDVDDWIKNNDQSIDLYIGGQFEESLNIFLNNCAWMANNCLAREADIYQRVKNEQQYSSIILVFGTNHSSIHHLLKRGGFHSTYQFLDDHQDALLFDPQNSLVKKIMKLGINSVTEFELNLALIGQIAMRTLNLINDSSGDTLNEQEMLSIAIQFTKKFKDMVSIKKFQQRIIEVGIFDAFEEI